AELAELETRIEGLRQQEQDAAEVVEHYYRQMNDLSRAIGDARKAMQQEAGEQALRRRGEAIRGVIHQIVFTFSATGQTGRGWGKKNTRLAEITFHPVTGDSVSFSVDSKGTLMYSSAHSRMYRTRTGRTR